LILCLLPVAMGCNVLIKTQCRQILWQILRNFRVKWCAN
jgi:hypothetical protein